jgi:hypothetical protein
LQALFLGRKPKARVVIGSVDDERCFNTILIMKGKPQNKLTTHLDLCIQFYNHDFISLHIFPFKCVMKAWKESKVKFIMD